MIATKLKENATRKMAPGLGPKNSATGTEMIFRALSTSCWTYKDIEALGAVQPLMDLMHHWQPCFRTVSAILIVLSTVVAKDAISSFHVQSDPSTDSLSSISLLGWLKTCPEDLAKHAGAFLLMAAR